MKENIELRKKILSAGISQRQICEKMGVDETYLSRILRHPATPYQTARIEKAIDDLTMKKGKPTTRHRNRS